MDTKNHDSVKAGLLACHECDALHLVMPIPAGSRATCHRCGAGLYNNISGSLNRALALNLTAMLLFIMAHSFPFLALSAGGRVEENVLLSGTLALINQGYAELGVLVFLTSILFPGLVILGMLYLLLPMKLGIRVWAARRVYRYVSTILPWSLIGVFMLGVLIAIVKLLDLAAVIPGISLFSLAGLLIVSVAATANLDPDIGGRTRR